MYFRKYKFVILLAIVSAIFFSGCSSFGRLGLQPTEGNGITLDDLIENSSDYDIYYWGYDTDNASGIIFDPKGDKNTLKVGEGWTTVERRETVSEIVKWLDFRDFNYDPRLYRILGPDNKVFGYSFTGFSHVVFKAIDPDTLFVYGMEQPPHYLGPEDVERVTRPD